MSADPRHPFLISHGLIDYPFPLSDGRFAELRLPERLTAEDAERLVAYVNTLSTLPAAAGSAGNTDSGETA